MQLLSRRLLHQLQLRLLQAVRLLIPLLHRVQFLVLRHSATHQRPLHRLLDLLPRLQLATTHSAAGALFNNNRQVMLLHLDLPLQRRCHRFLEVVPLQHRRLHPLDQLLRHLLAICLVVEALDSSSKRPQLLCLALPLLHSRRSEVRLRPHRRPLDQTPQHHLPVRSEEEEALVRNSKRTPLLHLDLLLLPTAVLLDHSQRLRLHLGRVSGLRLLLLHLGPLRLRQEHRLEVHQLPCRPLFRLQRHLLLEVPFLLLRLLEQLPLHLLEQLLLHLHLLALRNRLVSNPLHLVRHLILQISLGALDRNRTLENNHASSSLKENAIMETIVDSLTKCRKLLLHRHPHSALRSRLVSSHLHLVHHPAFRARLALLGLSRILDNNLADSLRKENAIMETVVGFLMIRRWEVRSAALALLVVLDASVGMRSDSFFWP